MNTEEQNYRNKGSLALLLALILLVGVAIVVYGIIVSAEQNSNTTQKTARSLYLDESLPETLEGMNRIKAMKEQVDRQAEELTETIKELRESVLTYGEFVEEMTADMLELNQAIATNF